MKNGMEKEKASNKAYRNQLERETALVFATPEYTPLVKTPALAELLRAASHRWKDTNHWPSDLPPQSFCYRGKRYALSFTWLGSLIVECSRNKRAVRVRSTIAYLFDPIEAMELFSGSRGVQWPH